MDSNPNADEQVNAQEDAEMEVVQETLAEIQQREENVPLKKYMAEKNARRSAESRTDELQSEIEELRARITSGMTTNNANSEVRRISQEHNVDETFLSNLIETVSSETRKRIETEINPTIQELRQDKAARDFDMKFTGVLNAALAELPDYADVIDKDDLKEWAANPKYQNHSMAQLIEEKYNRHLPQKRPSQYTHSAREANVPDTANPQTDEDFKALRADPKKRQAYNEEIMKYL